MRAITQSGYVVGTWTLPAIDAPVIAVLGIQAGEGKTLPFTRHIAVRAETALTHTTGEGTDSVVPALLYLAQLGHLRTPRDSEGHVAWPPIRGGAVVHDRREWRRPYLYQMTRQALDKNVLPRATEELWPESGVTPAEAIDLYAGGTILRADDAGLNHGVQWYGAALGYPECLDTAAANEMGRKIREQLTLGKSTSWREALSATVQRLAAENDLNALAALLGLIRGGHAIVHAAIRLHQRRALEELGDLGGSWSEILELGSGLNRLLYEPTALLGNESWQFATRARKLRITLPEVIGLGRDAIGRHSWLNALMAAYAEGDDPAVQKHLDKLRSCLALLAANPDALMMRPDSRDEREDLWAIAERTDVDFAHLPGSTIEDGLERDELFTKLRGLLTHPQWEALYLVVLADYSVAEAARQLGISGPAVSQRVAAAQRALSSHPQFAEWLKA